ncbi:Multidrug resistance protein stp [Paenibacillus konkukensis]|uniref:Multidrug resistance protein stp n=1 Tax=Paenibacillus konkukensis TaxID=2020716 RepID=A0ABY4RST5_9BACL|nr:Multidrug resistance protein stp [Paenibacillus konkukensis]
MLKKVIKVTKTNEAPLDPRRWWALAVVLSATFMALLDSFIVNVAIPSIQSDLQASASDIQFILAGYTLAYAVLLITGSRLGDMFGRKRLFLSGMLGFVIASALCGMASSAMYLILFRVLQGVTAAAMMPQVLAMIQVSFPENEKAKAIGLYGATIGIATVSGQLLGGYLISQNLLDLGWRSVFLVNVPIGVIALLAGIPLLQESRNPAARRLDLTGALILTASLLALAFPLVQGREAGWPTWSFILLACFPICLTLFIIYERKLLENGKSPLLAPSLFRDRSFSLGISLILVFYAIASALFFTLAVMLQQGFGYSALTSGLTYLPLGIGFFLASLASPKLVGKFGPAVLLAGAVITAVGIGYTLEIVHHDGGHLVWNALWPSLFIIGVGQGTCAAPLIGTILSKVRQENIGAASGVLTTTTQLSTALGVCFVGIFFYRALDISDLPDAHARYAHAFTVALEFVLILSAIYAFLLIFLMKAGQRRQPERAVRTSEQRG